MSINIKIIKNGSILELVLDKPERRNALNLEMYSALAEAFRTSEADESIRSILLYGEGGCFSSGNDLADFTQTQNFTTEDNPTLAFMRALTECPLPVVAAVEGLAVGIGTTLLLHCDLVYCKPDAVFKLPFVGLGLCPEYGASLLLPRVAGYVKAAEWLLLGEEFSAAQARGAGLINAMVDEPITVAREQCEKFGYLPPTAVKTTKALLKKATQAELSQTMQDEIREFIKALQGREFSEAVTAFFEKRRPDFSVQK